MPASNGGTAQPLGIALYPMSVSSTGQSLYFFDTTNFNDPVNPSSYAWKIEELIAGRTPTCNRQIITYRDLGVVIITCTLSGWDQNARAPVSVSQQVTLGTIAATGILGTTTPADLSLALSAMNLQFSITRAKNAGPLAIIKVRLEGAVEA